MYIIGQCFDSIYLKTKYFIQQVRSISTMMKMNIVRNTTTTYHPQSVSNSQLNIVYEGVYNFNYAARNESMRIRYYAGSPFVEISDLKANERISLQGVRTVLIGVDSFEKLTNMTVEMGSQAYHCLVNCVQHEITLDSNIFVKFDGSYVTVGTYWICDEIFGEHEVYELTFHIMTWFSFFHSFSDLTQCLYIIEQYKDQRLIDCY